MNATPCISRTSKSRSDAVDFASNSSDSKTFIAQGCAAVGRVVLLGGGMRDLSMVCQGESHAAFSTLHDLLINAAASKGEAYFKKMMANRAERAGRFLPMPTTTAPGRIKGEAPPPLPLPDVSLLDSFVVSDVEAHWKGLSAVPWLSDNGFGARAAAASKVREDQVEETSAAAKKTKPRRGIVIPPPLSLQGGSYGVPFASLVHEGVAPSKLCIRLRCPGAPAAGEGQQWRRGIGWHMWGGGARLLGHRGQAPRSSRPQV